MQQAGSNATLAEHSFQDATHGGTVSLRHQSRNKIDDRAFFQVGYMDPEFLRTREHHRYCEAYSMGITIFQVCASTAMGTTFIRWLPDLDWQAISALE